MSNLMLRVGASVDRSTAVAFKSVIDAAKAAQRVLRSTSADTTRASKRDAGQMADAHVKATEQWTKTRERIMRNSAAMAGRLAAKEAADAAREEARKTRAADLEEKARTRNADRESKKREAIARSEAKATEREIAAAQRANARALGGSVGGRGGGGRGAAASLGMGLVAGGPAALLALGGRAAGFAVDAATGMARGAGVNLDAQSHIASGVALESAATALSNSSFIAGDARNGRRADPRALAGEARNVGDTYAYDPNAVIGGLQAFAGKTGDLATGREALGDLARLSKATGTELQDMVDAAGDVGNALGDVPDKGRRIVEVMSSIAGQGKLGAVEIKDLAVQMAKLGAASGKFEGDGARNLAMMGAFAQEARARGGAASATQAATSVQSFTNTFGKNARVEGFKSLGIDLMSKTEKGKYRDPSEIMLELLQKTGADPQKMNKAVMDVGAQRVTNGFAAVYRDAYNSTQGSEQEKTAAATRAYRAELERLTQAAMGEGEIRDSLNAAMSTSESKAQLFNNQMDRLADEAKERLLPGLMKLGPALLDTATPAVLTFAEVLADVVSWGRKALDVVDPSGKEGRDERALTREIEGTRGRLARNDGKGTKESQDELAGALADAQRQLTALQQVSDTKAKRARDLNGTTAGQFFSEGWERNAATAAAGSAAADVERQTRLLQQLVDAMTKNWIKLAGGGVPPAQAPNGPGLRKPNETPVGQVR